MKSELRLKIESAVNRANFAGHELDKLRGRADLAIALEELDKMAERDALWGKMERDKIDVLNDLLPNTWFAGRGKCETEGHDTPLAAVHALVAKIEGGK